MSIKTTNIEERKLQYLLSKSSVTTEAIDSRFDKIDSIMNNIKVGDKVYDGNTWGDIFEQNIISILDKDNSIVELFEKSINKTTTGCILNYYLTLEDAQKHTY